MTILLAALFAAMTSSDALVTVLNTASSSGVERFAAARAIVEREAEEGRPLQQFVMATITQDKKLAERYFAESRPKIKALAEEKNNPLAWYLLSIERNDYNYLQKAADGGNVQALNALGTIATQAAFGQKGISTNVLEKVLVKSFGYFRRAALQRDPNGFINLGTCYLRGFGCRIDLVMAYECFRAAAARGNPEGMDYLSACYELGHGVKPDARMSLYWRMKAKAARGDAAAKKWLESL